MKQRGEIVPLFPTAVFDGGYVHRLFAVDERMSRSHRTISAKEMALVKPTRLRSGGVDDRVHGLRDAMSKFLDRLVGEAAGARDRKRRNGAADAALLVSTTELFQDLSDAIASEVALLDENGAVVMVNDAWLAGVAPATDQEARDWVGLSLWELLFALDPAAAEGRLLERQVALLRSGATRCLRHRYLAATPTGRQLAELRISAMRVGAPVHFVVVHENLGPEPAASEDQHLSAAKTLFAEEEARQRIAMELHDSTSQHLVALSLGMARLRRITAGDTAREVLANMSLSVNEMVREIRVLSYLLKPPELERQGLSTAVRNYVKGFGARTGLAAEFNADGAVDLASPAVRHAIYRIVQEALSNVYRHANASLISVQLEGVDETLKVSIRDDGSGIPDFGTGDAETFTAGVGISGMRTRVTQLGGRFDIASPGRGVIISAELPARRSPAH